MKVRTTLEFEGIGLDQVVIENVIWCQIHILTSRVNSYYWNVSSVLAIMDSGMHSIGVLD